MQKPNPLIQTKLRLPFTRSGLVSRPRIQELIAQGLRGPLTLITAPAGFGKTTLVVSCVAACGMRVAWLSLDKDDNQASRFLHYLVAALQEASPSIGSEAAQLIAAAQQPAPEMVLTCLVNDLDSTRIEIALVLDDYQLISNPAVHNEVAFLLDHCPSTFHLVIATRSDPPLPLSRLRARGQTVEIRAADLRFNEAEAIEFLNTVMGLHLDSSAVGVLEERTEGWIAGLQMAALALQGTIAQQSRHSTQGREDVDSFLRAFAGTNRFIMDFMLEEVLAREPEEVQAFLLQTAFLNRLTGPLCDAVTETAGGQEMLERLERRNLFIVPLDDDRRWYRYHHLFADLLQARLNQSGPERVARLLSRAAAWCEQDGQVIEAVRYAFAAKDYGRAAALVERHWQPIANTGEIDTVLSWLNALPEDIVRNSASLSTVYCAILWLTGQVGAIEARLIDAERALSEADQSRTAGGEPVEYTAAEAALRAPLAGFRSIVARYHEDFETAITLAERALSLIPKDLPPDDDAQLRGLAYLGLASALDGTGDLEKAVDAYAEAIHWSRLAKNAAGMAITYRMIGALRMLGHLRAADAACRDALEYLQTQGMGCLPAAGILHLAMSEVLVEQNDLAAAEIHLARGMELGKWSGRLDAAKNAAYVISRIRLARQDGNGALAAVQEAESAMTAPPPPMARADMLALKARILAWQGAVREAGQCIQEAVQLIGQDQGQTGEMVSLAVSRVLAAQSKPEEAVAQLTQSLTTAEARGRMGVAIELYILRSLALARQDHTRAAARASARVAARTAEVDLERALALAEPEGYVRIFIDEGQPMRMLLAQWLAQAGPDPLRDYAIRLLAQFDAEPQAAERQAVPTAQEKAYQSGDLVEPLSQRELEVLHLMALGKTNQQVAQQLIVAQGTIKAHAASIYRKLDVSNRTEAVARARQLGILP